MALQSRALIQESIEIKKPRRERAGIVRVSVNHFIAILPDTRLGAGSAGAEREGGRDYQNAHWFITACHIPIATFCYPEQMPGFNATRIDPANPAPRMDAIDGRARRRSRVESPAARYAHDRAASARQHSAGPPARHERYGGRSAGNARPHVRGSADRHAAAHREPALRAIRRTAQDRYPVRNPSRNPVFARNRRLSRAAGSFHMASRQSARAHQTVSYTHLTLPT